MTKAELEKEVFGLPLDERTVLAHALLASVEEATRTTPLTEAQKRMIESRLQAFHANPENVLTWEEVEAELWPER